MIERKALHMQDDDRLGKAARQLDVQRGSQSVARFFAVAKANDPTLKKRQKRRATDT